MQAQGLEHKGVPVERRGITWITSALTGVLISVFLMVCGMSMTFGSSAAVAYSQSGMLEYAGWQVGSLQLSDGTYVYCLEPGTLTPVSPIQDVQVIDSLRGYSIRSVDTTGWSGVVSTSRISGEPLRHMNYVMTTYGQAADPRTRVAVQLAVWVLRAGTGESSWIDHHFRWVREHGGAWEVARAQELVAEAIAVSADESFDVPRLRVSWDEAENRTSSTGTVDYPIGTEWIELIGASFDSGEKRTAVDPKVAGSLSWSADIPSNEWSSKMRVSATGEVSVGVTRWPSKIISYPPSDPVQQIQGAGYGPLNDRRVLPFEAVNIEKEITLTPLFQTAVVEKVVNPGQGAFADDIEVSLPEGQVWPTRLNAEGVLEFFPVTLEGTLYGPYASAQELSETAPSESNVLSQATLLVDGGPGKYRFLSDVDMTNTGFYYWQWKISESNQSLRPGIIPAGYEFMDQFGDPLEQQLVRMNFDISTELRVKSLSAPGKKIEDTIAIESKSGLWLQHDARDIPVVLHQYVYRADERPVQSSAAPESADLVADYQVGVNGGGQTVSSGIIGLPDDLTGWITVVTCIHKNEQSEDYVEWLDYSCDDYGIPTETAFIPSQALPVTGEDSSPKMFPFLLVPALCAGLGGLMIRRTVRRNSSFFSAHAA